MFGFHTGAGRGDIPAFVTSGKTMDSNIGLICGVGGLLGGTGMLFWFFRTRRLSQESQAWPAAPGTITRSDISENVSRDADGEHDSTTYTPNVGYEYVVDGQTYHGTRIQFGGPWCSSRASAVQYVERYPLGAKVEVFHDPGKPSLCTLDRTTSRASLVWIGLIAALLYVVGGLFLLVGR